MPKATRWFLLIPAIPTTIYVLNLLFYPNRDLLILWRREFNVPLDAILPLILFVRRHHRIPPPGAAFSNRRISSSLMRSLAM